MGCLTCLNNTSAQHGPVWKYHSLLAQRSSEQAPPLAFCRLEPLIWLGSVCLVCGTRPVACWLYQSSTNSTVDAGKRSRLHALLSSFPMEDIRLSIPGAAIPVVIDNEDAGQSVREVKLLVIRLDAITRRVTRSFVIDQNSRISPNQEGSLLLEKSGFHRTTTQLPSQMMLGWMQAYRRGSQPLAHHLSSPIKDFCTHQIRGRTICLVCVTLVVKSAWCRQPLARSLARPMDLLSTYRKARICSGKPVPGRFFISSHTDSH